MRETFFKKKTFSKGKHLSKNFPQFYSSSSGPGCSSTGGALVTFSYLIFCLSEGDLEVTFDTVGIFRHLNTG